jgi:hypothetical protein
MILQQLKTILKDHLKAQGITLTQMATLMSSKPVTGTRVKTIFTYQQVQSMLDMKRATALDRLEHAFYVLGYTIELSLEELT